MMEKTKTVAWLTVGVLVVLTVTLIVVLTTKETIVLPDGKTGTISKSNFLQKS